MIRTILILSPLLLTLPTNLFAENTIPHELKQDNHTRGNCARTSATNIPGLEGYKISSCCYKGCGGSCCRCGSASGYYDGCVGNCAIGALDKLSKAPAVDFPKAILIQGRLLHVTSMLPLSSERIHLTLPGGISFSSFSSNDGTFTLLIPSKESSQVTKVDLGSLPSVAANEREPGEDPIYKLYLANITTFDPDVPSLSKEDIETLSCSEGAVACGAGCESQPGTPTNIGKSYVCRNGKYQAVGACGSCMLP